MANQGWISVHREIFDNWIWKENEPYDKRSAWIDLLLSVNHEDRKIHFDGKIILVKRGQKITSLTKLAERWHWSRTKVKKYLELLQSDGMILLEIKPRKKTSITIVNYSKYQDANTNKSTTEVPQKYHRSTTEVPQEDINNNDNNDNNDNKMMIDNFCKKYSQLTNREISSSSIEKLKLIDEKILDQILSEIEKSTYLKNNADITWIINNLNKITEGKYRDYTAQDIKNFKETKFHNYQQHTHEDGYYEKIAREKRKKLFESLGI